MGNKPIEVIPKHEDPHHISCYRCDNCFAIFTMESHDDFELCPVCKHLAGRITKALFNLIKWLRKNQKHEAVADECKSKPTPGAFISESDAMRIFPKHGYY